MKTCIITLLCVLNLVKSIRNLEPITDREEQLALALTSIIQKFYVKQSNNIFVTASRKDRAHGSILQKTFAALDEIDVSVTWILHDRDYLNGNIDRISNIILIDSYKSFR